MRYQKHSRGGGDVTVLVAKSDSVKIVYFKGQTIYLAAGARQHLKMNRDTSETMAVDARRQKLQEAGKRARSLFLDRSEMEIVVEERGKPRKKHPSKRCALHNKILRYCPHPECGGGQALCMHRIQRRICKDPVCGGGQDLCIHRIQRRNCKDPSCGGGQALCVHRIQRRVCKDPVCGGGQDLCMHKIKRCLCKDPSCGGGKNLCIHKIDRRRCKDPSCGGGQALCMHKILRRRCKDPSCGGGQDLCMHKINRCVCKDPSCGGGKNLCVHKIDRRRCKDPSCGGGQNLCRHRILRRQCKDPSCGGGQDVCVHCMMRSHCKVCSACAHGNIKRYCNKCPDGGQGLCVGCRLYTVRRRGDHCHTCRKVPWQGVHKERMVGDALIKWSEAGEIPLFTTANKSLQRGTTTKLLRVDFLYDCVHHILALEIDEVQHMRASYNGNCELVRTYEIALACGVPTTFIRYNPDSLRIGGVLERVPRQLRHALLLEVLKESLALPSTAFLTVIYVFYDQPSKRMFGEAHDYVTTQTFATEVDYEAFVGSAYPSGCAGPAAGTPWYAKQD